MAKMSLEGNGRQPVIVLHGWSLDSSVWKWTRLHTDTARFTYAYVDFPGYGLDQPSPPARSLDEMARVALSAADSLGWDRFLLLGHDMGATAALRAASLAPGRVERLGLIAPMPADGAALPGDPGRWSDARQDARFLFALLSPDLGLDRAADLARLAASTTRDEAWRQYLRNWSEASFVEGLAGLAVPTRVILGEGDPLVTESSLARTLGALSRAEVVRIEKAGHFAMVERPREVVRAWERFFWDRPTSSLDHGPPLLA